MRLFKILLSVDGIAIFGCSDDEIRSIIDSDNPNAIAAQLVGATVEEIKEFNASHHTVQCQGVTRRGKRCKMIFDSYYNFSEWLEQYRNGYYCDFHYRSGE